MDNDEIRIKIAELKGVEYEVIHFIEGDELCIKDDDNAYMPIPNWSVSIADAWELVEEMKRYRLHVKIKANPTNDYEFSCSVESNEYNFKEYRADTAPRAICLAYIAYKESQK
jgi:hypothetical protein